MRSYEKPKSDKRTDVAVEEPRAGVVGGEADGDIVARVAGVNDVAHHGVIVAAKSGQHRAVIYGCAATHLYVLLSALRTTQKV